MEKLRRKIEIFGLKLPEVKEGDDLARLIVDSASKYANGIEEKDIIVVTSKVVSKAYGLLIKLDEIKPSKKATEIANKTGEDARFIQALLDNSDKFLFVIPFKELVKKGVIKIEKVSKNKKQAYKAIDVAQYLFIVKRGKQIYSDAGLDFSNHPRGVMSVPPKDPDSYAREIRRRIFELTGKDVAVIISDTEISVSTGSLDFARGCSGIQPVSKKFGEVDLYGKPKFGGIDHVANELACASALLMGQTSEGMPVVIIRGYEYVKSEEGISDYRLDDKAIKEATLEIIKHSIRILGIKWFFKQLICDSNERD